VKLFTQSLWLILLLLAFAASPAQGQKLPQVRVALSTPTPHMAPLYVAKDKKLFEKYGLDVQLILVNSGSLVAQMFASGELQMTANAPASLVNLAATGEKMSESGQRGSAARRIFPR